ncbi:MAG: urease accessory protein UreE [Merismopediaceae bacterium]|nr:urease accessory protein UreE [Merismopediaceae bacterium]
MLIFQHRLDPCPDLPQWQLPLTAEERRRSRYRFDKAGFPPLFFQLPRGTILNADDYLQADSGEILQILAAPEALLQVSSDDPLALLKAAYHLGNRHVSLEVQRDYLRLATDPVLEDLLATLNVTVETITAPFFPESGAFHSH